MRILFVLGGRIFFRFVDGVVRELAASGHQVEVLTPVRASRALSRCQDQVPGVTIRTFDEEPYLLKCVTTYVRHLRSYCHWLEPEHRWPDFLRRRWAMTEFGFPRGLRGVVKLLGLERFDVFLQRWSVLRLLERLEEWIPPNPGVVRSIQALRPDLVVCTPVVYPSPRRHTTEVEYLKAARALGLPTAALVASWDNLSMKGIFYVEPDLILVWNEIQIQEAETFHDIPAEKVVATGAPLFDVWFDERLRLPRDVFLPRARLRAEDDYVLYVESSAASGDEWHLIHQLAEALDHAGASRSLTIMVRRHPSRRDKWEPLRHSRLSLYPSKSVVPDTVESRGEFYNSICHARAVIGVNTTVFLEAAILDRPCISILDPDKDHFQGGMVHFRYLMDSDVLDVVSSPDEGASRILEVLDGQDGKHCKRQAFVESFIRPAGKDRSASRVTADALVGFAYGCGSREAGVGPTLWKLDGSGSVNPASLSTGAELQRPS